MPIPSNSDLGPVVGLDYGTVRVGVAVSDGLRIAARPFIVLSTDLVATELVQAVADIGATKIVVGLPVSLAGIEGESASGARKLAEVAMGLLGLEVEFADERFTSATAEARLLNSIKDRKQRRKVVDAVAAAVMLQGWLDSQRSELELPARYRALDPD